MVFPSESRFITNAIFLEAQLCGAIHTQIQVVQRSRHLCKRDARVVCQLLRSVCVWVLAQRLELYVHLCFIINVCLSAGFVCLSAAGCRIQSHRISIFLTAVLSQLSDIVPLYLMSCFRQLHPASCRIMSPVAFPSAASVSCRRSLFFSILSSAARQLPTIGCRLSHTIRFCLRLQLTE